MKILYELVNWSMLTNSSGQSMWGNLCSETSKVQKGNIKVVAQGVFYELNNIEKQDHM